MGLKMTTCMFWLKQYAIDSGDHMPDKSEIHLSEYIWKMVYLRYISSHPEAIVGYPSFMRMRRRFCPQVKVRKCKQFAKCHHCVRLTELVKGKCGTTKCFWESEMAAHNSWQMRERMQQAKQVEKATNMTKKQKALVMMVDNMDHSKSDMPHFKCATKDMEHSSRLVTHMTGVHVPGWRRRPTSCYTWYDQFPTGSDSVITIILMVLCEMQKDGPLPETLYLHLDNCWRENKNQYVLGIAHMLVERGVFKRVKLAFLPVGHTHNIVDQMFSCFAKALKSMTFSTLQELHEICRLSYKQSVCGCGTRWEIKKAELKELYIPCGCAKQYVHMEHVDQMACWGPVLREYLASNIYGISKPRYFRIQRSSDGVVRHHYRAQLQKAKTKRDVAENLHVGCSMHGSKLADFDKDKQAITLDWMPMNTEGFRVFPNEFPPIHNIFRIPKKALDWKGLQKTHELICDGGIIKTPECEIWGTTLKQMEDEHQRYET
jgi:hypothetical protein